jgi:hypothetical protein
MMRVRSRRSVRAVRSEGRPDRRIRQSSWSELTFEKGRREGIFPFSFAVVVEGGGVVVSRRGMRTRTGVREGVEDGVGRA